MKCKTWRFHQVGGPEVLQLDELEIREPKPHEVRVQVKAVGLNRSDLIWMSGSFFQSPLPSTVGSEICGIVEKVGSEVTGFKPGDRVSTIPTMYYGDYTNFAEYAVVPASALVPTPESLSDAEGASFLYVHLTQMCGLSELAQIKPGQTLLVTGGTSANGLSAILIGRRLGAKVIATSRKSAKCPLLLETGADAAIATEEEPLAQRVMEITNGVGADVIYDCVGGDLTRELINAAASDGLWVMYGFLDPSPTNVLWADWFTKQVTLRLFSLWQFTGMPQMNKLGKPIEFQRAVKSVLELCGSRELAIPIAKCFEGIESVADAFRLMEANVGGGKIAVTF